MEKKTKEILAPRRDSTPQLKIRSSLTAGASLQNCLQNLDYWQKQYHKMCG